MAPQEDRYFVRKVEPVPNPMIPDVNTNRSRYTVVKMSPNDAKTYEAANKTMADLKSKYPGIDLTKKVSIGPREEGLKPFEGGKKTRTTEPGELKKWEGKPSTQRTTEGGQELKTWGNRAQTKEPLKSWDEGKMPPKVQRTYDEAYRTFHRIKNQYEKGSGPTVTFPAPNRMLGPGDTVSGNVVRAYITPPTPVTTGSTKPSGGLIQKI